MSPRAICNKRAHQGLGLGPLRITEFEVLRQAVEMMLHHPTVAHHPLHPWVHWSWRYGVRPSRTVR